MLIVMIALSGASVTATGVQTSPVQNVESQNVTEVSVNPVPTVSNSKQRRQYRLAYVSWKNRIADLRMSAIFKWLRTEYYPSLVSIADAASSGSSGVSFARDSMTIQDAWWDLDETMDMDLHRDSKTWNFSIEIHSPSGGIAGSRITWGYDFVLDCIINAFAVFDMLIRVTYEDEKHGDVVVLDQISDGARDSNDLSGNYDEVGCGCGFIYDQFKDFMVSDLRYCVCCGSEFVLPDARDSDMPFY